MYFKFDLNKLNKIYFNNKMNKLRIELLYEA